MQKTEIEPKVRDLNPEIVKKSVAETIERSQQIYKKRGEGIEKAVSEEHLNFLLGIIDSERERALKLITRQGRGLETYYFGHVVESMPITHINKPNHPFEMVLRSDRKIESVRDIGVALAEFIQTYFPGARKTDFSIYDSLRGFRKNLPIFEYQYAEEFVRKTTEGSEGTNQAKT